MPQGIVTTIGQRCKRCYSCIRECPARAIRVLGGQAVVIEERCISCGHCVKVCSQNAKKILSDVDNVLTEIIPGGNAAAILAPSFPASFPENYSKVPAALRKIGFNLVSEAAFGADLISSLYAKYFEHNNKQTIITSPCPAVYNLIEKYYEVIVPNLAGVVSPMVAMGRYIKKNFGLQTKVVFIGPCVAKKSECLDQEVSGSIDAVLTFKELKEILNELHIDLSALQDSGLDTPHAYMGKSYPLTGGLLKTANIPGDILQKEVIVVEGKNKVIEIVEEIASGNLKSKFVDILFCEGCINGPAIDSDLNYYSRREKVIGYINDNINAFDKNVWKSNLYNSRDINLTRNFHSKSQRKPMPKEEEIKTILAGTNKLEEKDELNCGSCGYTTCREYAIAIAKGLAEEDMCLPYLIEKLELAYKELQDTQEQLHSAEKLASIGQLAAGVAHEINNPLGSIMLYASILKRKIEESTNDRQSCDDIKLIMDEANRCKRIVSNLLNFARQRKLKIKSVNVAEIISGIVKMLKTNPEFLQISFSFNEMTNDLTIDGDPDQLKQVFLNLIVNACEALESSPIKLVTVNVQKNDGHLIVDVIDTGCGIPEENINKIFTPFFSTKKMGKGTGLGLAITYGIIKMHKGDINVKSIEGKGTTFTIKLPLKLFNKDIAINKHSFTLN
ncbi:MAG: [Fe-Fe] hydrogenase large subunit C-terminal domain-containing protein [Bacteroidota bacterium]